MKLDKVDKIIIYVKEKEMQADNDKKKKRKKKQEKLIDNGIIFVLGATISSFDRTIERRFDLCFHLNLEDSLCYCLLQFY